MIDIFPVMAIHRNVRYTSCSGWTPRKMNVVVTRGLLSHGSCINEQLKCVETLLRDFLCSLEHCIAFRGTSISWELNNICN